MTVPAHRGRPTVDGIGIRSERNEKARRTPGFFIRVICPRHTALNQCSTGSPRSGQRQYAEALSIVMAHELLRLNDGAIPATRDIRGGLAGWQEKKVA